MYDGANSRPEYSYYIRSVLSLCVTFNILLLLQKTANVYAPYTALGEILYICCRFLGFIMYACIVFI